MDIQLTDVMIRIDEDLEEWQRNILEDHMRMQQGVIAFGYNSRHPHLIMVGYQPEQTSAKYFLRMVERHGYHAARVG
ncbi:MAG: hypothetical protein OQL09_04035 [Gammaproteobacteria bacterium]|nr:hypothetical protein [Gammaproteobacteria bacterium]